jgi:hypothetical protein
MNQVLAELLTGLQLAEPQQAQHIAVFPLFAPGRPSPDYLTLAAALEQRLLTVTEVSVGGSVPELRVSNKAAQPVLLLDGEEVCGAKQNRVLNTSILVPEGKQVDVPVSCTEQGRWSYVSPAFSASGHVMHASLRASKTRSVSCSLAADSGFTSNQGEVWQGISDMACHLEVGHSKTGALKDVFEARQADIDTALQSFALLPDQQGILVLINGAPVGFDYVSLAPAFAKLHGKLVRSYVLDALARKPKKAKSRTAALTAAQAFLAGAAACEEKQFKSIGLGEDHRCKAKGLAGSALVHAQAVIHTAFFRVDEKEHAGHMSDLNRRRNYRGD